MKHLGTFSATMHQIEPLKKLPGMNLNKEEQDEVEEGYQIDLLNNGNEIDLLQMDVQITPTEIKNSRAPTSNIDQGDIMNLLTMGVDLGHHESHSHKINP